MTRNKRSAKSKDLDLLDEFHSQEPAITRSQIQIFSCLGNIAESCDRAPGNHVARVGFYSVSIAQKYGWPARLVSQLALAAPLHDIGKVGVPDKIIQKRGELQEDEEIVFRRHCILGKQILQSPSKALTPWLGLEGESISFEGEDREVLDMAAMIALSHHESWDGSGYPIGLKGEEIPLPARIVAYADHYDVLTAVLPGEVEHTHEEAVQVIVNLAGKQFDPGLLDSFLAAKHLIRDTKEHFQDHLQLVPEMFEVVY